MRVICDHDADEKDILTVKESLLSFNSATGHKQDEKPLNVFLRDDDGEIVGGVIGRTYWGWLYVKYMWVSEHCRAKGHGKAILLTAEQEAINRGCNKAHLDTFSFQSLPFLRKQGYEVYGVLEDCPEGQRRYFLQKQSLDGLEEE